MVDKPKLLLVEDEEALRMLARHELEDRGFEVTEAESGEMAMEKLVNDQFKVVVLDIRLPGIDGLEVLRNIRKDNLAEKVIMLTGVDELKVARDSLSLGANDYLTKPYDFKNLINCIQRVLKE
ncbi:MAG: response regulator [Ignavibacteria bacterium]|nr:response regulator [Ignavibacteria bacterium]